jgi:pimeloyl-ACP methyl ester carboxylesterase
MALVRNAAPLVALALLVGCVDDAGDPPPGTSTTADDLVVDARTGDTPHEVTSIDGVVTHGGRDVAYRVYAPVGAAGPAPVLVVSHGGLGSEVGHTRGEHLGTAFAEAGYVAVHVGHRRSDRVGGQLTDRPADVTAVLDAIEGGSLARPTESAAAPDVDRVGHVGHSFGAYTSQAVAGATYTETHRDDRVDAIAPLSPQGAGQFGAFDDGPGATTWSTVDIPTYDLIGSEEKDGNVGAGIERKDWRLEPFENYPATADHILTVLAGQGHSDLWSTGSAEVEAFITGELVEFFDVYLAPPDAEGLDACEIGDGSRPGAITQRRPAGEDSRLDGCDVAGD